MSLIIQPFGHHLHTFYFSICVIKEIKCRSSSGNCLPKIGYFAQPQSFFYSVDAKFLTSKLLENINLAVTLFAILLSAILPVGIHLNLLNSTSSRKTLLTKSDISNMFPIFYIMFHCSNYSGINNISRISKKMTLVNFLSLHQLTPAYQTTE